MTEQECINFYRGLFRLLPELPEKHEKEVVGRCCLAFKILTSLTATRDHVRIALAQHRGNSVKRAWDLKQKYIITICLENPQVRESEMQRTIKSLFNQKTRHGVYVSCREHAEELRKQYNPEELQVWIKNVRDEFLKKAKEPNVLGEDGKVQVEEVRCEHCNYILPNKDSLIPKTNTDWQKEARFHRKDCAWILAKGDVEGKLL